MLELKFLYTFFSQSEDENDEEDNDSTLEDKD